MRGVRSKDFLIENLPNSARAGTLWCILLSTWLRYAVLRASRQNLSLRAAFAPLFREDLF